MPVTNASNLASTLSTDEAARFIFDAAWYRVSYGLEGSDDELYTHFISNGWRLGLDPSPLFDVDWYQANYPDIMAFPDNPLAHYCGFGWREGRAPHPLFDAKWFAGAKKLNQKGNPLVDYMAAAPNERADPHPLVDAKYIREQIGTKLDTYRTPLHFIFDHSAAFNVSPHRLFHVEFCRASWDVKTLSVLDLLMFYLSGTVGWADTHILFDANYYAFSVDIEELSNELPLMHYIKFGSSKLRSPHPLFDPQWYLRHEQDSAAAQDPLSHYLGRVGSSTPHPLFSDAYYVSENLDYEWNGPPLVHYALGMGQKKKTHPLFDGDWYIRTYPDCSEISTPLSHYLMHGWIEGRNPNGVFDERRYWNGRRSSFRSKPGLVDYCYAGHKLGGEAHPFFDEAYYLAQRPTALGSPLTPLGHYLTDGDASPHEHLLAPWYRRMHMEATRDRETPLEHFARLGVAARLDPAPWFDMGWRLDESARRQLGGDPFKNVLADAHLRKPILKKDHRITPIGRGLESHMAAHLGLSRPYPEERREYRLTSVRNGTPLFNGTYNTVRRSMLTPATPPHFYNQALDDTEIELELGESYLANLENASCRTLSRILIPRGETAAIHDEYSIHGLESASVKSSDVHVYGGKIYVRPPVPSMFIERGIHLLNEHDNNYFHWIVEMLPRLVVAEQGGAGDAPLILSAAIHPNMLDLAKVIAGREKTHIAVQNDIWVNVGELFYPSDVAYIPDIYERNSIASDSHVNTPELKEVRKRILAEFATGDIGAATDGIYVARASGARRVLNEDLLTETLRRERRFARVSLEGAGIREQVVLFGKAREIVMPTGAAMTNILWCQPGARVICLVSDHASINPYIWQQLADISGVELSFVRGTRTYELEGLYSIHDNFSVDPDEVIGALG